jgi:hypothetical protein
VLEIFDATGRLVRHYSSAEPPPPLPDPKTDAPLPLYWYRKPQPLMATAGMHRFTWDVHYQPLPGGGGRGGGGQLPIAAVPYDTVPAPTTPWVAPGQYVVKLTVDGTTYTQPITVKQDPRVKTPPLAMQQVYTLSRAMYLEAQAIVAAAAEARTQGRTDAAAALDNAALGLRSVMNSLQAADVPATARQLKAIAEARAAAAAATTQWKPK